MPTWREISQSLGAVSKEGVLINLQHKYLQLMKQYTGRNIIIYYSAFMQKPGLAGAEINDNDKNAFMQMVASIPKEERQKGLDLVLHTPGGEIAATESLVYYLKSIFKNNIRVVVPQMAMSAGTMIALSSKEIIMGKESNLGPIDPQFGGVSCYGVVEEFKRALADVTNNPSSAVIWANIIGKYHPTFLGDCEKAIDWSSSMVTQWLLSNMFAKNKNKDTIVKNVVEQLSNHGKTYAHRRHIHAAELRQMGLRIKMLESFPKDKRDDCDDLQDCVLTLHHVCMQMLSLPYIIKIISNGTDIMLSRQQS